MMTRKTTIAAGWCVAAAACPAQTTPATPPPATPPAVQLEQVQIKSAIDTDDRRDSTAGKIVVTRDELARYGDTTVAEVLNRVPGVTVSGVPGRGGEVRMRGLGNGYVSILLNGEPTAPGFSIDSISPTLIDRIEVLRSPTADKSAQAIAGTINIILKQAIRAGQRDLKVTLLSQQGRPSAMLGGQVSDRVGTASYRLAAEAKHEEYRETSTTRRNTTDAQGQPVGASDTSTLSRVHVNAFSLTPRINFNGGERDAFVVDGFGSFVQVGINRLDQYTATLGTAPFITETARPSSRHFVTARGRLSWVRKLDAGAQFEAKFGAAQTRQQLLVTYNDFDRQHVLQRHRTVDGPGTDRSVTISGKYRDPMTTGHTLSAGWDGERIHRADGRYQHDDSPAGLLPIDNRDEWFEATVSRLALFAQDEWAVNTRWSVYAGLRWESIQTRTGDTSHQASVLSPTFQSLWKVPDTQGDQVRFALSRTYKAPGTRDLSPRRSVGAAENTPTSPDLQGNPTLRPELAWGLDLGYERYLAGQAGLLSANMSARQIQDVTLQEVFYDPSQALWISRPFNSGNARVYGLELEAKTSLRKLAGTAPAVDLRVNLSRNWSRVDAVAGPNNRLSQQTPLSANLGADWRPDSVPLTLGGNFGVSTGGPVTLSSNQTSWTSVKRQLDAYGVWKFNAASQMRLSVSNLLHQDQVAFNRYQLASGSLNQRVESVNPTTWRLAWEAKL